MRLIKVSEKLFMIAKKIDPFTLKAHAKWNPVRFLPTIWGRLQEQWARLHYDSYSLPLQSRNTLPPVPDYDQNDTAVTSPQMQHLLEAAHTVNHTFTDAVAVEVGCYRGVTTRCLGEKIAPTPLVGVDPFIGWGGAEADYRMFSRRISEVENVRHKRCTSGEAARNWDCGPVGFVFIDAVHDYWNTKHDIYTWKQHLASDGLLAAHDTDSFEFAGTRRAVYEEATSSSFTLYAHLEDLTILQKT